MNSGGIFIFLLKVQSVGIAPVDLLLIYWPKNKNGVEKKRGPPHIFFKAGIYRWGGRWKKIAAFLSNVPGRADKNPSFPPFILEGGINGQVALGNRLLLFF